MKSNLSKITILTLATILTVGVLTNTIFAATAGQIFDPITPIGGTTSVSGIVNIIVGVFKWIYTIFFIIAGIMLLFAAFTYLTSGGDPEKVGSAKNQIIYTVVAIVVALLAVSIRVIVQTFIESPGA